MPWCICTVTIQTGFVFVVVSRINPLWISTTNRVSIIFSAVLLGFYSSLPHSSQFNCFTDHLQGVNQMTCNWCEFTWDNIMISVLNMLQTIFGKQSLSSWVRHLNSELNIMNGTYVERRVARVRSKCCSVCGQRTVVTEQVSSWSFSWLMKSTESPDRKTALECIVTCCLFYV